MRWILILPLGWEGLVFSEILERFAKLRTSSEPCSFWCCWPTLIPLVWPSVQVGCCCCCRLLCSKYCFCLHVLGKKIIQVKQILGKAKASVSKHPIINYICWLFPVINVQKLFPNITSTVALFNVPLPLFSGLPWLNLPINMYKEEQMLIFHV